MLAMGLAITAAASWGFSAVLVRLGLRHISTTIGTLISLGAGLVFTEMTCVSPEGRITPGCPGLWDDAQTAAWRRITDFVHERSGAKIGLLGPLRVRVDYRIFKLLGSPTHDMYQRFYVGANLNF